ncbi:probable serine carboxypeptidase CPVL [Rhipicephalus sanguineus]|uniref:probable serine carboxypeptidase CPVL n=1 Tax=Rhipicephalus sanguineus TaxID=34632 RepID=UPI001894572F|nr:probable serine carboxypeptidase CPVL [Rhipicephalus sanguineus]
MQLSVKIYLALLLCLLLCVPLESSFLGLKRWPFRTRRNDDHCQFLTPMIEKHAVQSARDASFAKIFKNRANATAYSGFITVNKKQQSNLFFIYMQAEVNRQRAPLMIYLQGGPGKSGTFGQFLEVGPLGVNSEGILYRRSHTVQKMFNVIFLDQPAGSGFSSTKSQMGYARSIDDCVTGMREFLRQFLVLFPENRNRELYVAGESYGSRGAVALAHSLMTNPDRGIPLKVSGVIAASPVFGNALDLLDSADTLYQFGMLDSNGRDMFAQAMHRVRHLWANNRTTALHILSHTIFRLHPTPSLFTNLTSYNDHASLLSDQRPREFIHYNRYMQKPLLKKSLHLCSRAKVDSSRLLVMLYLAGDYDTDLRDKVQYLLDATKMLVFTGQVDTVFPAINQEKYMMSLNWTGTAAFRKAARRPWYVDGPGSRLTGYVKTTKDLTYVVLTRAGHHVLADASEAVYNIIESFASGVDIFSARRKVSGVN